MIVYQSVIAEERYTALKQVVGTGTMQISPVHRRVVAHTIFCINRIAVDTLGHTRLGGGI